jgi:hypothetical protein
MGTFLSDLLLEFHTRDSFRHRCFGGLHSGLNREWINPIRRWRRQQGLRGGNWIVRHGDTLQKNESSDIRK